MGKFPIVIPPTIRKPKLPIHDDCYEDDKLQELLAIASGAQASTVLGRASSSTLVDIIDPETGDSPLHRAASAGVLEAMDVMMDCFGPNTSQRPSEERLFWTFMTHQNKAGDTALHSAARSGQQIVVVAIYRMFHMDALPSENDDAERGPDSKYPAVEHVLDWDEPEAALLFLTTKNSAGRDAAAEARHAGHIGIAEWLEALAENLDVNRQRTDKIAMRLLEKSVLDRYWYLDDTEAEEDGFHGSDI
ncbi:hypothetical protein F5B22DRAFT_594419 [Xylaria bambusicola]|uniref:uncharacterized protein n=1 Tax=Xylaria bambusicola TaxID=326684 RepID=UPI002007DA8B|nr:uncharacterized protein F5B22DRAFT_594419 [Xylaria bambusicola]KAI0521872.1 hypothetical protein F5B22DRAFT_594419 [Xylaria bambusicola]